MKILRDSGLRELIDAITKAHDKFEDGVAVLELSHKKNGDERRELGGRTFRYILEEDTLKEYEESDDYTKEEVEKLRTEGELDTVGDVYTDSDGDIFRINTLAGDVFYVLAQSLDGHGNLVVFEEERT